MSPRSGSHPDPERQGVRRFDRLVLRPRRWLGLRLRFILAISTLLALVLAGNAYVFVIETARSLRAEIEARAVAFGTLAVEPLATAYDAYAASGRPS